jgi:hypothetical protein
MQKKKWRRLRALSDLRLQGGICLRVAAYWMVCLLAVTVMLGLRLGLDGTTHSSTEWWQAFKDRYAIAVLTPIVILPFAIVDCIIYTNRIIGPFKRLRAAIRVASRGEPVEPIVFRKGDIIAGTDHEFNVIIDRLRALEGRPRREPAVATNSETMAEEFATAHV